jgi:Peptidase M15
VRWENRMISEHFGHSEFFQSGQSGLVKHCDMVKARFLSHVLLESARDEIRRPIFINSGKRSVDHNRKVGGVQNSEHLWSHESAAIDIDTRNSIFNKELFLWLYSYKHKALGQLIAYFDNNYNIRFIHLSIVSDRHPEMQALTATYEKVGDKRIYQPFNGGKPRRPKI